jgi:aminopeptidase N
MVMKRRWLVNSSVGFLLLILGAFGQIPRQEAVVEPEGKGLAWDAFSQTQAAPRAFATRDVSGRVLHYQLDLDFTQGFTNNTPLYSGRERVTWKPESDSLIILDFIGLRIDSVLYGTQRLTFDTTSTSRKLKITLPSSARNLDSVLVDIWYAYTGNGRRGYYYYDASPSTGTLERLGYTFTEPDDTPYWVPCINDPSVKVPCKISARVPTGFQVASNGLLKQVVNGGDGTTTFYWEERYPVAMYLMVVTISRYSTFSHYYRRVTNPSDSIEVKYYVWQADSAGQVYNAVNAFRNVLNMMRFFSTVFGEYPFDKYGMAVVYPFGAGGMEHQTMTTIHRSWISGAGSQGGIAHELAHQWWGNMVTCATWADIWLNEGFATYSEAMWEENFYDVQTFRTLMSNIQFFGSSSWQYPIYNPPPQFLFGSVVYHKAAWVLHMLRYLVGDSTFLAIFKEYRKRFEHKAATTEDFIKVVNDVSAQNLRWFFDQWIYRKGWPVYAHNWFVESASGGYKLTLTLQQQQSEAVFQTPVQVLARAAGGFETRFVVNNTERTQAFQYDLSFHPDSIVIDPDAWILKQMSSMPVSVGSGGDVPKSFVLYQNYPNPFNPRTVIRYDTPVEGLVTITVYDVLGRTVETLVNERKQAGHHEARFDGKELTSGLYFYRLTVSPVGAGRSGFIQAKKMILIK